MRLTLWNPKELIAEACARVTRNLTGLEWRSSLKIEPYGKTCASRSVHPSVFTRVEELVHLGNLDEALAQLNHLKQLAPQAAINPGRSLSRLQGAKLINDIDIQLQNGDTFEAITSYFEAQELTPGLPVSPQALNRLCWEGAINSFSEKLLKICDQAVSTAQQEDRAIVRDSRGVARALSGDLPGALEDFNAFLSAEAGNEQYKALIPKRRHWIEQLESGKNPITDSVLNKLGSEHIVNNDQMSSEESKELENLADQLQKQLIETEQ